MRQTPLRESLIIVVALVVLRLFSRCETNPYVHGIPFWVSLD